VICYFVGKYFKECIIENNSLFFFENVSLFKDFLKTNPLQNKSILIKGSRGIALEQILDSI
jgi:UDP-N-acetylmuramoyl-tripeptide--D-alanyl-D-alanine ligase